MTTATPYPLYPDVGPYEKIVTQYSLHRAGSGELAHTDYLADPRRDCQRELIEKLLSELGRRGSIVVYTGFEERRFRQLAERFPDLRERIDAVVARLFDLHREILRRGYYYHPSFRGSSSIKSVLPVLVPDLTYSEMPLASGQEAEVAFARLALGEYSTREAERARRALLAYCELDSLAMLRVHRALLALGA